MKINLNNQESIILNVPEEVDKEGFFEFLSKMTNTGKFIGGDPLIKETIMPNLNAPADIYAYQNDRLNKREFVVDLLKLYYDGKKNKVIKELNKIGYIINRKSLRSKVISWRNKFDIEPKEVGLINYVDIRKKRIKFSVEEKNYIIDNYKNKSINYIAKKLKRTPKVIRNKLRKLIFS